MKIPKHCHHKASGRGVVRLAGKDRYTGTWGTPEADAEYERLIAEWLVSRGKPQPSEGLTVVELLAAYLEHCEGRRPAAKQLDHVKNALRAVRRLYGHTKARDFGPLALKAVRQTWIDAGLSRNSVNHLAGAVKQLFRWATEQELIPGGQYQAIKAVPSIPVGDPTVKPSKRVQPVSREDVEKTLAVAGRVVRDMVRVQLLTGCRASEIANMRPCDIDRDGKDRDGTRFEGVWVYEPPHHKTVAKGHRRVVFIGPKAQAILTPYLDRPPQAYLFSPAEAARDYALSVGRACRPGKGRQYGDRYPTDSYIGAIERYAKKAGVPHWSSHQLRHARATEIRSLYGPDAARVVLGHALPGITGVYAAADLTLAAKVARETG